MYIKNIDNRIYDILKQAGLSASEKAVYIAGLQNGPVKSAVLVQETNLPRVAVQLALKELIRLEVCKATPVDKRTYIYEMLPPSNLKKQLGVKIRHIENVMDELDRVSISGEEVMQTQEAQGQQQLQNLLELALRCKSREWSIIAPKDNALLHMSEEYKQYFKQVRKERQIVSKTLWEAQFKGKNTNLRDVLMRKPRFVPDSTGKIPSILLAFDDSLLMIEGKKAPRAVLIRNKAMVSTYQIVFDIAWQASRGTKS